MRALWIFPALLLAWWLAGCTTNEAPDTTVNQSGANPVANIVAGSPGGAAGSAPCGANGSKIEGNQGNPGSPTPSCPSNSNNVTQVPAAERIRSVFLSPTGPTLEGLR